MRCWRFRCLRSPGSAERSDSFRSLTKAGGLVGGGHLFGGGRGGVNREPGKGGYRLGPDRLNRGDQIIYDENGNDTQVSTSDACAADPDCKAQAIAEAQDFAQSQANSAILQQQTNRQIMASLGSSSSSVLERAVALFRERVSVSGKLRAGVGPAIDVGPTAKYEDLAETGTMRVNLGIGEGLGASAGFTADVLLISAGPEVNSPFFTTHTICAGFGPGGCASVVFFENRALSLSISAGIVGGLSITNTVSRPARVRVFPSP